MTSIIMLQVYVSIRDWFLSLIAESLGLMGVFPLTGGGRPRFFTETGVSTYLPVALDALRAGRRQT